MLSGSILIIVSKSGNPASSICNRDSSAEHDSRVPHYFSVRGFNLSPALQISRDLFCILTMTYCVTQPPVQWILDLFPRSKAAEAWHWPHTPSSAAVKERVELYIYSPSGPWSSVPGWTLLIRFYVIYVVVCRCQLKCDGTGAETRFRLSAKRTSLFKSTGRQFSRLLAAEVCASAVVMLDISCSDVVWRVLATHSIRQFLHSFPSRASPCAITIQLDSTMRVFSCTDVFYSNGNQRTQHYNDKFLDPNLNHTFLFMAPNPMLENVFNGIVFPLFCLFYDAVCN
jgi:hypothetical protein